MKPRSCLVFAGVLASLVGAGARAQTAEWGYGSPSYLGQSLYLVGETSRGISPGSVFFVTSPDEKAHVKYLALARAEFDYFNFSGEVQSVELRGLFSASNGYRSEEVLARIDLPHHPADRSSPSRHRARLFIHHQVVPGEFALGEHQLTWVPLDVSGDPLPSSSTETVYVEVWQDHLEPIPEPSTYWLMLLGLSGVGLAAKRAVRRPAD